MLGIIKFLNHILWSNVLAYVLVGVGILYTVSTGFVQFKHFGFIMKKTLFSAFKDRNKVNEGDSLSTFKAMMMTLAGNIGGGNVVGVTTAIIAGGMGSIFWMWVAAFLGMATKYGEIILSQYYRDKDENGNFLSGPMYYIRDGLKLKWLGIVIAILMTIKMMGANLVQSNTIANIVKSSYGIDTWIIGIVLSVLLYFLVIGGLKTVANTATKLVPLMSLIYAVLCVLTVLVHIDKIGGVFYQIFTEAFSFKAVTGGTAGIVIANAMRYGIARGMYSNEAGEGTAPFAHGTAIVSHPVEEGIAGVTEVFIDTIVICTLTALTVGVTGILTSGQQGVNATNAAINSIGFVWSPLSIIANIALLLFCFTTLMGQWFNAAKSFQYAYGNRVTNIVKWFYPLLCIAGALNKVEFVWELQDLAMGLVVIPNLIALILLFPKVRMATKEYFGNKGK